jgi:uncharacterized membrane protein YeaQ/YmgE (transglycosylase-associated protein family)
MFTHILFWLITGLFVGFIARILVPGRHRLGLLGTSLVGILGSFVGGFLGYALFNHDKSAGAVQPAGLLGSVLGAVLILWLLRRANRGSYGARR